ncbi:winged helix-turn-helix domain-containing protein [Shewanella acanthi]|uniref:winged helix-turn-helix domain-containing protein n=1 Tax=Shewanella acanthi TaxID=2864212 RepID=UPI001C656FB5|nr:helix-turn-helix domain-containing protein [Shewanella acanthi]QYJ78228.1 helix-turn-helix domain-containing protein [Shewanella acanthi]
MQVGGCWFDRERGLLIEQTSQESWHLPRAELQVLCLLVEHQGKLVSKHDLKTGDGVHTPLTDTSLARAVFKIRSFLGPQHEGLIETVKGQGYLLHSVQGGASKRLLTSQLLALPSWSLWLVFGFMLAFIVFYIRLIDHSAPTNAIQSSQIYLPSGQVIQQHLYAQSKTNNTLLFELGERLSQSLSLCSSSNWQEAYISLSHDKQVLNITLRGQKLGQSVVRNLKISDLSSPKKFIDSDWLQGVEICD